MSGHASDLSVYDYMQTDPYGSEATLGAGVQNFQTDGILGPEFQSMAIRRTPPYGEPDAHAELPEPVLPTDPPVSAQQEDEFLHDQLYGAPWRGYEIRGWVNPSNPGVPNLGPDQRGPYVSSHSQAIQHNSSAEQGWGLDPAVLIPRYPVAEGQNPWYATGTHRRNGAMEFAAGGIPFDDVTQEHRQRFLGHFKRRSTVHGRLVDNPNLTTYSSTVPVAGQGGPLELIPEADAAIY